MNRGRPPRVKSEEVCEVISLYKKRVFVNGKIVSSSNSVFKDISFLLLDRMTPKAIYLFIKKNKDAKLMYNEWGFQSVPKDNQQMTELDEKSEASSEKDTDRDSLNGGTNGSSNANSNGGVYNTERFDITLSSKEWTDIAPRNIYYKNKNRKGKSYKGLAPNLWTHVVNEHFWLVTKKNCCLVFKRASISETKKYYVRISAICKGCRGTFIGYIHKAPVEGQRAIVRCKYTSSKDTCDHAQRKRILKGDAKDRVRSGLQFYTAGGLRTKLAHEMMEYGDKEPSHLPSSNALRCVKYKEKMEGHINKQVIDAISSMKYTIPFNESIHNVGLDKFFVHYWTPSQINCYREVCKSSQRSALIIDATGNVVRKINRPFNNKSGSIFLYQAVYAGETSFPVTQMLTERHDNISVQCWLEDFKRAGAPIPTCVTCDRSKALLSGIVRSYTNCCSLIEYVNRCFDSIFSREGCEDPLPKTFVRCDVAHVIKNITSWKVMSMMTFGVKNLYVRSITEILKSDDMFLIRKMLKALFVLCESTTIGKRMEGDTVTSEDTPAEKSRKFLNKCITTMDFDIDALEEDDTSSTATQIDQRTTNKFHSWTKTVLAQAKLEEDVRGEHYNALYCPKLVNDIVNLMKDLPLISSIMCPYFNYATETASSAHVESTFNVIKNVIFQTHELPMRVDDFIVKHIAQIEGQLKLSAASHQRMRSEETIVEDDATQDMSSNLPNDNVGLPEKQPSGQDCPECSRGNFPGGAHLCMVCKAPVHIIFDTCSRAVDEGDEGYGEKRICTKCFNSSEDRCRENWRGQGNSPRPSNSSKRRTRKVRNIRSYLIRQPDFSHISIEGRGPKPVGVLKNGNRCEELRPITLLQNEKITLQNTCAFDSAAQIFACATNDSEEFKKYSENYPEGSLTKSYFDFCCKLGSKGISAITYKNRLNILLSTSPKHDKLPGNITLISTESTAANLIGILLRDCPVKTDETRCDACQFEKTLFHGCFSLCLTGSNLSQLVNLLAESTKEEHSICECGGQQKITRNLSRIYLVIELIDISNNDGTSDILKEYETKPCDIPMVVTLNQVTYTLRGFLGFSGRRSSLTTIGHYVAYVRRSNDTWELYDDTRDSKISVSASKSVPCQVLFYTI